MSYRVIAAAGIIAAIGLAAVLAAPWYSGEAQLDSRPEDLTPLGEINAWQAFDWEDGVLLVLAVVAAVGLFSSLSVAASGAIVASGAGAIALGLILYRLFEQPHETGVRMVTTEWGAYVALAAADVLVWTSLLAYIEERPAPPATAATP
jgi:hypothetical protein